MIGNRVPAREVLETRNDSLLARRIFCFIDFLAALILSLLIPDAYALNRHIVGFRLLPRLTWVARRRLYSHYIAKYGITGMPGIASDGTATGSTTGATTATCTLTTSSSNDVIIIAVGNRNSSSQVVSSISDANSAVSWQSSATTTIANGTSVQSELWYGIAANPLSSDVITVHMSASAAFAICALAISGANTTTPFPAAATTGTGNGSLSITASTTVSPTMGICFICAQQNSTGITLTSGNVYGTAADASEKVASAATGTANVSTGLEWRVMSTNQTSQASTWTDSANRAFAGFVDAVQQSTGTAFTQSASESQTSSESIMFGSAPTMLEQEATGSFVNDVNGNVPQFVLPITLTNGQGSSTGTNFPCQIIINSNTYSTYESTTLLNINFQDGNGLILSSWLESGETNTSTSTVYWVKIPNGIGANSSVVIYMVFYPTAATSKDATVTGAEPKYTGTYGQYDNGSNVFTLYNNFSAALSGNWTTVTFGTGASATVSNGITFDNGSASSTAIWLYYNGAAAYQMVEMNVASYSAGAGVLVDGDVGACEVQPAATGGGFNGLSNGYNSRLLHGNLIDIIRYTNAAVTDIQNVSDSNMTGIVGQYWPATGTEDTFQNYVQMLTEADSNITYANVFPVWGFVSATTTHETMVVQWVRVRTPPPSNIMPSASFGSIIIPGHGDLNVFGSNPVMHEVSPSLFAGMLQSQTVANTSPGAQTYYPLVGSGLASGSAFTMVENCVYHQLLADTTFQDLIVNTNGQTNGANGATTFTLRKNAANTFIAVSIGPSSTGVFEDATDFVNGTAGDNFDYAANNGGSSGNWTSNIALIVISAAILPTWLNGAIYPSGFFSGPLGFGTNPNLLMGGAGDYVGASTNLQFMITSSFTVSHLQFYVTNNSLNASSTIRDRINGSSGSISVSVAASGTGTFSDTVDTDSIKNTDVLLGNFNASGSTSGSADTVGGQFVLTPLSNSGITLGGIKGLASKMSPGTTSPGYFPISGDSSAQASAVADGELLFRAPITSGTCSNLQVFQSGSNPTSTITVNSVKNGVAGNLSVSAPANIQGRLIDTTDTDTITTNDTYALEISTSNVFTGVTYTVMGYIQIAWATPNDQDQITLGSGPTMLENQSDSEFVAWGSNPVMLEDQASSDVITMTTTAGTHWTITSVESQTETDLIFFGLNPNILEILIQTDLISFGTHPSSGENQPNSESIILGSNPFTLESQAEIDSVVFAATKVALESQTDADLISFGEFPTSAQETQGSTDSSVMTGVPTALESQPSVDAIVWGSNPVEYENQASTDVISFGESPSLSQESQPSSDRISFGIAPGTLLESQSSSDSSSTGATPVFLESQATTETVSNSPGPVMLEAQSSTDSNVTTSVYQITASESETGADLISFGPNPVMLESQASTDSSVWAFGMNRAESQNETDLIYFGEFPASSQESQASADSPVTSAGPTSLESENTAEAVVWSSNPNMLETEAASDLITMTSTAPVSFTISQAEIELTNDLIFFGISPASAQEGQTSTESLSFGTVPSSLETQAQTELRLMTPNPTMQESQTESDLIYFGEFPTTTESQSSQDRIANTSTPTSNESQSSTEFISNSPNPTELETQSTSETISFTGQFSISSDETEIILESATLVSSGAKNWFITSDETQSTSETIFFEASAPLYSVGAYDEFLINGFVTTTYSVGDYDQQSL